MDAQWVAGIHPPSVTLAKLTVRRPVARALDTGTGNGIQALLASRHARAVTATDVNPRALAFGRLNAGLNGVENLELREGSYFEPVEGERFDLLTCNPPYVISPERTTSIAGRARSVMSQNHCSEISGSIRRPDRCECGTSCV